VTNQPGEPIIPLLLDIKQTAAALGIGVTKCREIIATGELECVRLEGMPRIPTDAVKAYVEKLRTKGAMPL
jgi:excisionase family DNA binding protein